jgi:hypothetical protein
VNGQRASHHITTNLKPYQYPNSMFNICVHFLFIHCLYGPSSPKLIYFFVAGLSPVL